MLSRRHPRNAFGYAFAFSAGALLAACGARTDIDFPFDDAGGVDAGPDAPEASAPDTSLPDVSVPDVSAPDTSVPDTSAPDTSVPDTSVPDTSVPDTSLPDTSIPDTSVPDTSLPDTSVPDTSVPDTSIPDTSVPETSVPDADEPDGGPDGAVDAGPVCATLAFGGSPVVAAGTSVTGSQNVPAGVTPTGSSILVLRGGCSSGLSLYISDEAPPGSGTYQTLFVVEPFGMDTTFEENATLTPDGLTIIGLTSSHTGFVASSRSAVGLSDFGAAVAGPFAQITTSGAQHFWAPSLSPDGLAFYYVVQNDPSAAVNGIYESLRATTSASFPPGTRMLGDVQSVAQYVNGFSTDRLTIFLEEATVFGTAVLTRASLDDPFTNPLAPNSPPTVPGLRTRPIEGCTALVGSCSPHGGGCTDESVCVWGP